MPTYCLLKFAIALCVSPKIIQRKLTFVSREFFMKAKPCSNGQMGTAEKLTEKKFTWCSHTSNENVGCKRSTLWTALRTTLHLLNRLPYGLEKRGTRQFKAEAISNME